MLPIILPREQIIELMNDCDNKLNINVNLQTQKIIRKNGNEINFEINSFRRHCLLNGLDDIGLTMEKADKITEFEHKRSATEPWMDNAAQDFIPRK